MAQSILIVIGFLITSTLYLKLKRNRVKGEKVEYLGREFAKEYINRNLENSLKLEKGKGCDIPKLNPYSKEITQFDAPVKKIECSGPDWVKCYMSQCQITSKKVIDEGVYCLYQDIIYINDYINSYSTPVLVKGGEIYNLTISDHVDISCAKKGSVYNKELGRLDPSWSGMAAGIRSDLPLIKPPPGREDGISVLVVGFDSVSKNMFLRKLPKSYNYLKHYLNGIFLNGYNIVGDGTSDALFPFLSGKTRLELPEATKNLPNSQPLKVEYFIFHLATQDGYRTLFFEDAAYINTFQNTAKGFLTRPADHYLRPFCVQHETKDERNYCVGDTPQYKWMLNLTQQFLKLNGKKFGFNFMVEISHDDFNLISVVDDDLHHFLRSFKEEGHTKDTMLILMSDHGPRYFEVRATYQGKIEEHLPVMAIVLPDKLTEQRSEVRRIVEANAEVVTTPFDMYATMLDVMDLTQYWKMDKIKGADLPRSLSVLRPIPRSRTCSEAGIEPHYCSCFEWGNVSKSDPMYERAANALVDHINALTMALRYRCALRILTSVEWVLKHIVNVAVVSMQRNPNKILPNFFEPQEVAWDLYQVRIEVIPAKSAYEGTIKHIKKFDKFVVNSREISRVNAYGHEPDCIKDEYPDLRKYCYCYN